jgi:hypothetical protein
MSMEVRIDADRVTIGFLMDLEEAAASSSLRKMVDLYVNGLGMDREALRKLPASALKDLGAQIRDAVNVGNGSE